MVMYMYMVMYDHVWPAHVWPIGAHVWPDHSDRVGRRVSIQSIQLPESQAVLEAVHDYHLAKHGVRRKEDRKECVRPSPRVR
jgi:hypothetical protein